MQAYRRLANQRGKKFRIFYDDTATDDETGPTNPEIRAALERSARSASGRAVSSTSSSAALTTDPAVHAFFRTGALDYSHRIAPGFYACFGEFPEVADKGELPALSLLRKCVVLEGREVITVDPTSDQGLSTFLDVKIIEAVTSEGSMQTTRRVATVAGLVAARLGGASQDLALAARYSQYSNSMQLGQQSAVLPLGMLTVRPAPLSWPRLFASRCPAGALRLLCCLTSQMPEFSHSSDSLLLPSIARFALTHHNLAVTAAGVSASLQKCFD